MAQCKRCERAGVLFWTNGDGLCRPCEEEIRNRVAEERERVKEALIWVRCNKSIEDRLLQLQRAMDGVRALQRYEKLGCRSTRPTPDELAEILRRKLEEVRVEQAERKAQTASERKPADGGLGQTKHGENRPGGETAPPERAWDRRRTARQPARFVLSVVNDGVRGRAEDVSVHGVRFRSPVAHRSGSRIHLQFKTPVGEVAAEGVVRWSERGTSGAPSQKPCTMGIEWTEVPGALRGYLEGKGPGRGQRLIA